MKRFNIIYIISILLTVVTTAFTSISAQSRIDSLKSQLEVESDDIKLAEIYYELASKFYYSNPDTSLKYTRLYMVAARNANHVEWLGDAYYWMSDLFYYTNMDSSLYYCNKYLESAFILNDTSWIGDAYYWIGDLHYNRGNIQLALENYELALSYFEAIDDAYHIGACYNNIGYTVSYGTDQSAGLAYFLKALQIAEENDEKSLISNASCNIAYYYDRIKDYSSAQQFYQRALDFDIELKDSLAISLSYASLASINTKLRNYNEAKFQLAKAKSYISTRHMPYNKSELFFTITESYLEWEKIDSAEIYIDKAEKILNQFRNPVSIAYLNQQKGFLSYLKGDYNSSIHYLEKSIQQFQDMNSPESFAVTYKKIADAYSTLNMFEQAYEAQLKANLTFDSLQYSDVARMLSKMEQDRFHKAEIEKNDLEIELANQLIENSNIQYKARIKTAIITIALLIVLAIIGIYTLVVIRRNNSVLESRNDVINNQKQLLEQHIEKLKISEEELKELNATKDRFFSIIGHDLRNPFSAMIGWSDLFLKDKNVLNSEDIVPIMESLNSSANYAYSLLENLLIWAKSQTGALTPIPGKLSIASTLQDLVKDFKPIINSKNIKIELNDENLPLVFADGNMVATVVRNLLHNAVKFSYNGSVIKISASIRDNYLITTIADQGVGITKEEISKLFSLDGQIKKKGTSDEQGSGLGLILCKEFVEKNKGKIWAESLGAKGSAFSFSLPLFVE